MNILRVLISDILPDLDLSIKEINYYEFIYKLVLKLNLSTTCEEISRRLLDDAIKNGFTTSGKDPKGIAADLIYLATKKTHESRLQLEIAKAGKTTEVTLRSRIRDLKKFIW